MKTKFTIPSKFRPSFKGKVYIIVILFFSPFICVFINYITSLYLGDLYTFGISERKDFFTVWIALFGAIGIAFNIYQNQKRTKNQEEQLEKQQTQIDLQRKSQCDSRFSKGIELLGNDNESARTGAAYSLCFLAKDYPDEFSKPVFEILCSHIRTLTTSEEYLKKHPTVSNEVQTILNLLFKDVDGSFSGYKADLRGVHLRGADLERAFLMEANLEQADLGKADLRKADLKKAKLRTTILNKAKLMEAKLMGADFGKAKLIRANFWKAELMGAFFGEAKLIRANFWKAELIGADFGEAILWKAILIEADLENANLEKAHLEEAHLEKANLKGTQMEGAYFNEKYFNEKDFKELSLKDEDLAALEENRNVAEILDEFYQGHFHLGKTYLRENQIEKAFISSSMRTLFKKSGADLSGVNWVDDEKHE